MNRILTNYLKPGQTVLLVHWQLACTGVRASYLRARLFKKNG